MEIAQDIEEWLQREQNEFQENLEQNSQLWDNDSKEENPNWNIESKQILHYQTDIVLIIPYSLHHKTTLFIEIK